jgi:hypothetical protein
MESAQNTITNAQVNISNEPAECEMDLHVPKWDSSIAKAGEASTKAADFRIGCTKKPVSIDTNEPAKCPANSDTTPS